jgi:hypothetical protein
MAKFVQIIEYKTTKQSEMDALEDQWRKDTEGKRGTGRSLVCKDRDRPDTYVVIVEFPSYAEAMRNNELPATGEFASKMEALSDGPATFRNLDVEREETD